MNDESIPKRVPSVYAYTQETPSEEFTQGFYHAVEGKDADAPVNDDDEAEYLAGYDAGLAAAQDMNGKLADQEV